VCVSLFSISFSLSEFWAKIRDKNNSLKTLGWVLTTKTIASWRFRFAATLLPHFQTSALCLSLSVRPSVCVCVRLSVSLFLSLSFGFSYVILQLLSRFFFVCGSPSLSHPLYWFLCFCVLGFLRNFLQLVEEIWGRTQQSLMDIRDYQQACELDCWPGHANCATRGGKVAWSAKQNQGPNAHWCSNLLRCCRCSCETSCYSC
jgi:hypothetical protein